MTTKTQPLAALLASHPEECAAVVAVLCARGEAQHGVNDRTPTAMAIAIWPDGDIEEQVDLARSILVALDDAGATSHAGTMYREFTERDRYAIARMGAAAWLAARVAGSGETGAQAPKGEQ